MKYVGEIITFVGGYAPAGTIPCDGRRLKVIEYKSLFSVIGDRFTGEVNIPNTFRVPEFKDNIHYIVYEGLFPVE